MFPNCWYIRWGGESTRENKWQTWSDVFPRGLRYRENRVRKFVKYARSWLKPGWTRVNKWQKVVLRVKRIEGRRITFFHFLLEKSKFDFLMCLTIKIYFLRYFILYISLLFACRIKPSARCLLVSSLLAKFKYIWQILKLDFLKNEVPFEQILFHIFDLFFHSRSSSFGFYHQFGNSLCTVAE